jgi:hypothetical protein
MFTERILSLTTKEEERLYTVGFESIAPMTVKKQEGIEYDIGTISNWNTKATLASVEDIVAALYAYGYKPGTNKEYVGLQPVDSSTIEEFKNEKTVSKIFKVSYKLDKKCHKEIQNCVWTAANINKFRADLIKIGRLYQEKTIDYAKKISLLDIIESPMKAIIMLSLKRMEIRLEGEKIIIKEPNKTPIKNKIIVNDPIHQTRVALATEYKNDVEDVLIPLINKSSLPAEIKESVANNRFGGAIIKALSEDIKMYYNDIVAGYQHLRGEHNESTTEYDEDETVETDTMKENYKDQIARIENMIRLLMANETPERIGELMKYISGRTKNNELRDGGTENKIYMSLCTQEYVKWLLSLGLNDIDFCGYKLLGNKGYTAGSYVYFENGQASKAILDGTYTGWLEIKEFNNNLYGAMDINDTIVIPERNNKILVKIQQGYINSNDIKKIEAELTNTEVTFSIKNKFSLVVTLRDGTKKAYPYALTGSFSKMFDGMSGRITGVNINTTKSQTDGALYQSVYLNIDFEDVPVNNNNDSIVVEKETDFVFEVVESSNDSLF